MNPLVSYIVPVYNAEKFLLRTLNALAGQTYKNIEVILVDDGSSDSSGSICDDFCSADSRFKCIHIKNGGVSHARNTGLENADGDYIMFCDSDDLPHADMVQTLVEKSDGADITLCGFNKICGDKTKADTFSEEKIYTEKSEIIKNLVMPMCVWGYTPDGHRLPSVYGSTWRGLYAKHLFDNAKFDEEINHGEDLLINLSLFTGADKIKLITGAYYDYIENPASITHTDCEKRLQVFCKLWKKTGAFLRSIVSDNDNAWLDFQLSRFVLSAITEGVCSQNRSSKEKTAEIKKILSMPELKTAAGNIPSGLSKKDLLLLKMLKPAFAKEILLYCQRIYNSFSG
jgi:glycosyltransferase involved in cell wall biosynthesis